MRQRGLSACFVLVASGCAAQQYTTQAVLSPRWEVNDYMPQGRAFASWLERLGFDAWQEGDLRVQAARLWQGDPFIGEMTTEQERDRVVVTVERASGRDAAVTFLILARATSFVRSADHQWQSIPPRPRAIAAADSLRFWIVSWQDRSR